MTATTDALRDAVQPPTDGDGGSRGLPGATCRTVGGVRVYTRDGQDWLSVSSVLRVMGLGRMPDGVKPEAIEYGRIRGVLVGDAAAIWVRAGRPLIDAPEGFALDGQVYPSFGAAMDAQVGPYLDAVVGTDPMARRPWSRFSLVPYLVGLEAACREHGWEPTETEVLCENERLRVFGFVDLQCASTTRLELKTSKTIRLAHRLQAGSYGALVVRLGKGPAGMTTPTNEDGGRWDALVSCAHEWVREQDGRSR